MSVDAWYIPFLSSIPSGLVGAVVVYYFGLRQRAKERHFTFLERQLTEFYAPLSGLRKQIHTKSELRVKVEEAFSGDDERQFRTLDAAIEYHNRQFLEELMPQYRQMLTMFTERYHLADADTRAFYSLFLEFVEIWNMSLAKAISGEAIRKLGHSEERVKPFYEHLEQRMQQLQDQLVRG